MAVRNSTRERNYLSRRLDEDVEEFHVNDGMGNDKHHFEMVFRK
jgi:hypothetical protein